MKVLVYAPLLASAVLLGWLGLREAPEAETVSAPIAVVAAPASNLPPMPTKALTSTEQSVSPASLRGTQVDGTLTTDSRGNLIVTEQLRDLFEYYLATVGEVELDQALILIDRSLTAQLTEPALSQARSLLDDYLQYKHALAELEKDLPVVSDLAALNEREQAVRRLRAERFDPLVQAALFGAEQDYNQYHLDRLAIVHDATLSPAERADALEQLRQQQPEALQETLAVQVHQQLSQQTQALQSEGGDPAQLRQLRLELVGPEATQRLEQLDAQRQKWDLRLAAFDAQRQAILDEPGLAESDKREALRTLLEQDFDERERLRVTALLDMR